MECAAVSDVSVRMTWIGSLKLTKKRPDYGDPACVSRIVSSEFYTKIHRER